MSWQTNIINKIKPHWRLLRLRLKSKHPMRRGVAYTQLFVLVVAIWFVVIPEVGASGDASWRIWNLLTSPANEIGDTLAGIAGVLAFLWIIVTVMMQSIELKEQRQEFKKMADAQREQVKLLVQQLEIAKQELDDNRTRNPITQIDKLNKQVNDQMQAITGNLLK